MVAEVETRTDGVTRSNYVEDGRKLTVITDLFVMEGIGKPSSWSPNRNFYYEFYISPEWRFGKEFKIDPNSNKIKFVTFRIFDPIDPILSESRARYIKEKIVHDIIHAQVEDMDKQIEETERFLGQTNNDCRLNQLKCELEIRKAKNFYNPFRKRINGEYSFDRRSREAAMYYAPLTLAFIANPYAGLLSPAFILLEEAYRRYSKRGISKKYNSGKDFISRLESRLTDLKERRSDYEKTAADIMKTPLEFIVCESAKQFVETFGEEKKAKPYFTLNVPRINEILLGHYMSDLREKHGLKTIYF